QRRGSARAGPALLPALLRAAVCALRVRRRSVGRHSRVPGFQSHVRQPAQAHRSQRAWAVHGLQPGGQPGHHLPAYRSAGGAGLQLLHGVVGHAGDADRAAAAHDDALRRRSVPALFAGDAAATGRVDFARLPTTPRLDNAARQGRETTMRPIILLGGAMAVLLACSSAAMAQKSGGILKIYHRDNPPSASIHEEATNSTVVPFMSLFNNLVLYDQSKPQNSPQNIVPDLAKAWRWSNDGKDLTFTLQEGVKWHDGQPFTAKDVVCTFDLLTGKGEQKLRRNPRTSWYGNVEGVSAKGDYEVTVHLKRAQPSLLALLASGYSAIYPCHVPAAQMRTKPIGTGPFKFVEFKQNEGIRLAKNPDYWKKGRPYLDGIEFTIVPNRAT